MSELRYPPKRSVERIWNQGLGVLRSREAQEWLESRALDVARVARMDVCRVLHPTMHLPDWARKLRRRGYVLMFQLRDAQGEVCSLLFRHPNVCGDSPKTLTPQGYQARGLVLSRGVVPHNASQVVMVEGEVDWMTWVLHSDVPCIGVRSGSWSLDSGDHEASIPMNAKVYIRTDCDKAGDGYAKTIGQTLASRQLYRLERIIDVTVGMDGKAIDDNDRLQKNQFKPDPCEHTKHFTPPPREPRRGTRVDSMLPTPRGETSAYGRKALEDEVARVKRQGQGGRNNQLYLSSRAVGNLVAGGEIAREEAIADLELAGRSVGLDRRAVRGTVKSGLRIGGKRPRRAPESMPAEYRKRRPVSSFRGESGAIGQAAADVAQRNLSQGRVKLADALARILQEGGLWVVRSVCGSGKTYATCQAVINYVLGHENAHVRVVLPTREVAREVLKLYRKYARPHKISVAMAATRSQDHCLRHEEVAAAARVHPEGPRRLCEGCRWYRDDVACPFWFAQKSARAAQILITTHALELNPSEEERTPDVLVIDESVWRSVRRGGGLTRDQVARLRDAGDLVNRGEAREFDGAYLSPIEILTRLMFESEQEGSYLGPEQIQTRLEAALIECPGVFAEAHQTLKHALKRSGRQLIETCAQGVGWEAVAALVEALEDQWRGVYIKNGVLHAACARDFASRGEHATIVLDATTSLVVARVLHGVDAQMLKVAVDLPQGLDIVWVRCNTGPQSRVGTIGEGLRTSRVWLASLLHWGQLSGCLNVTHKRWRQQGWTHQALELLASFADTIHHGGIEARGSNAYKDHHTARIDAHWVPRAVVKQDAVLLERLAHVRAREMRHQHTALSHVCQQQCVELSCCDVPTPCPGDELSKTCAGWPLCCGESESDQPVCNEQPEPCTDPWSVSIHGVDWCKQARWQLEGAAIVQVAARIRLYSASPDNPKRLVFVDTRSPEHFGFAPTQVYEVEELLWDVFGETSYHCARQVVQALLARTSGVLAPTIEQHAPKKLSDLDITKRPQRDCAGLVTGLMALLQTTSCPGEPTSLSQRICAWVHKYFDGKWEHFASVCGVSLTQVQTEHGGGAIPILHAGPLSDWQIERCLAHRSVRRWRHLESEIWHPMPGTCPPLVEALLQIDDLDLSLGSTAMCDLVAQNAGCSRRTVQRWVSEYRQHKEDNKAALIRLWHDTHAEANCEVMEETRVLAEARGASEEEATEAACERGRALYVPPWRAPFLKDTAQNPDESDLPQNRPPPSAPGHQPWLKHIVPGLEDWEAVKWRAKN